MNLKQVELVLDGTKYVVRQITVQEADDAFDAAKGPDGEVDSRLYSRLILASSLVEPKATMEEIMEWPLSHYMRILSACNELNMVFGENPTSGSPTR